MINLPSPDFIAALEAAYLHLTAADDDASHGLGHARRVLSAALEIASQTPVSDTQVLAAAAYFHDLVNLPKNHPDRASASRLSAEAARPVLEGLGMAPARIEATAHAIEAHSFSANIKPESFEAKALQDADRLEALGALGIARTFYIAGRMGSALFSDEDPEGAERPLDDKAYALDHFELKLFRLPETMQTEAGRKLAAARADYMRDFIRQLLGEIGAAS
ncbi:HD domain-containing protein [Pseudooceanicola sp. 200-1SW]|uniref:HD domain-containing protein n=1 Tax=Pseudooceanicola sp. 200-1SW TaxID=3425949 RepID=UPI003D7F6A0C